MIPKYLSILKALRSETFEDRQLAAPLISLPDPAANPSYYVQISDPISLDQIETNVNNQAYPTAESFDRDLHRLFKNARLEHAPPSPIYGDILALQRRYHELTKVPNVGGKKEWTMEDTTGLESVKMKGEQLRVGDWIHVANHENPAKPTIAQVYATYKRTDGQRCLSVCWFFRPEETMHNASRTFYENEVFKTSNIVEIVADDFIARCFVMFISYYVRGRPKKPLWEPGMDVYVCEHKYIDKSKSFSRIKNWAGQMPEE
ncbi:BAH-domain-containing protein, partial [Atractiella rhizophila]